MSLLYCLAPSFYIILGSWALQCVLVYMSLHPIPAVSLERPAPGQAGAWPQCPLLQVTSPVLMSFASFLSSRLSSPRSWGGGACSSATTRRHTDPWPHLLTTLDLWGGQQRGATEKKKTFLVSFLGMSAAKMKNPRQHLLKLFYYRLTLSCSWN